MAKIYLVRHAESIANTQGIYQGITYDTELSARGKMQAVALAGRFRDIAINDIITSPLKRTYETALCVAEAKGIAVCTEMLIRETNHGDWEGKPKQEIDRRWPKLYKKWQRFPSRVTFPEGEQFIETQERVLRWWHEICQNDPHDTLVVSHDNIIRILIAHVFNMKLNKIWKFHLQSTGVTEVDVVTGKATIVLLNDTRHIGRLEADLATHAL